MSADNYFMVRKHPKGGFTYVMGFASDVDEDNIEIIPEARESDPIFVTRDLAMEAALREEAEYGASFHPETCWEHRNVKSL